MNEKSDGKGDERAKLLAAVCAAPDDDRPRLAYADWCEGNDDPDRAEFIRLQCGGSRPPDDAFRGTYPAGRELELLKRHESRWVSEAGVGTAGVTFSRGFVNSLTLAPQRLAECAAGATTPLRAVRFSDREPFGGWFGMAHLQAALTSPHMQRFSAVSMYHLGVGLDGWRAAADSPHLTGLRSLDMGRSVTACPESVRLLAESPTFAHLRVLGLEGWTMRVRSAARRRRFVLALAWMDALRRLEAVDLSSCCTPHVVEVVVESGWRLRQLYLLDNNLRDENVAALAEVDHLADLTTLDLSGNRIGDRGAVMLAEGKGLRAVRHLDLSNNPIGRRGRAALRQRFGVAVTFGSGTHSSAGP